MKTDQWNVCRDVFLPRMEKKISLYLKVLILLCLVSTPSSQFYWQNSKRKHGGGKIKQMGKTHVHHIFKGINIISKLYGKFVRGSPAQKTRTGYTADLQQYLGLHGWKRCQQAQALLTAMVWQYEGQHGPDVQSDSGVPRRPCNPQFA